jgi:hypothetical protein
VAIGRILLGHIGAVEEFAVEQLHRDDTKNELEEKVDDENVKHILQRVDNAIEHRLKGSFDVLLSKNSGANLQFRDSFNCLERPKHTQHSK